MWRVKSHSFYGLKKHFLIFYPKFLYVKFCSGISLPCTFFSFFFLAVKENEIPTHFSFFLTAWIKFEVLAYKQMIALCSCVDQQRALNMWERMKNIIFPSLVIYVIKMLSLMNFIPSLASTSERTNVWKFYYEFLNKQIIYVIMTTTLKCLVDKAHSLFNERRENELK